VLNVNLLITYILTRLTMPMAHMICGPHCKTNVKDYVHQCDLLALVLHHLTSNA